MTGNPIAGKALIERLREHGKKADHVGCSTMLIAADALEAAFAAHDTRSALVAGDGGEPVTLTYTNYRGETAERTITPKSIYLGSTEWHPEPQWLLRAYDHDKQADRDFALKDFGAQAEPDAIHNAEIGTPKKPGFHWAALDDGNGNVETVLLRVEYYSGLSSFDEGVNCEFVDGSGWGFNMSSFSQEIVQPSKEVYAASRGQQKREQVKITWIGEAQPPTAIRALQTAPAKLDDETRQVLERCQAALAMTISPESIKATSVLSAFTMATAAEAAARELLGRRR